MLKSKQAAIEEPTVKEPLPDMQTTMLNGIIDLENELNALKKRIKSKKMAEKIDTDEIDHLRYIREEIQTVLSGG